MKIDKWIFVYLILAVVVVVLVAFAANIFMNKAYDVTVKVLPLNSNGNLTYSGLYPYNTTFFSILVNNTGNTEISGVPLVVYVNGKTYETYNLTIPKGEGTPVHMNYTYDAPGNMTFEAVIDPAGLFNIKDRSQASNTVAISVGTPVTPSPYLTIPPNGITGTEDSVLRSYGISSAYLLANTYNSPIFSEMLGPKISAELLATLAPYTYQEYSVFANYLNGSSVFTTWMEGSQSPYLISKLLGNNNAKYGIVNASGRQIYAGTVSNDTSFCMDYYKGWTRISYYQSNSIDCKSFGANNSTNQTSFVANAIESSNALVGYSEKLFYSNSTGIGSGFFYSANDAVVTSFFYNNYGDFVGLAEKNSSLSGNFAPVCAGTILNATGKSSICSSSIIGFQNLTGYALANSTAYFNGYRFSLYSVVGSNSISTAYLNAEGLINSLGFNGTPIAFSSYFKNSCTTSNSLISCTLESINSSDNIANVLLDNRLNGSIHINSGGCYIGTVVTAGINVTIPSNSEGNIELYCSAPSTKSFSLVTDYNMILNYTYDGTISYLTGVVGVSNFNG